MIIQALPGLGKSYVVNAFSNVFDSDIININKFQLGDNPVAWEDTPDDKKREIATYYELRFKGDKNSHLVTNTHLDRYGCDLDLAVYVSPDRYIKFLEKVGRKDLLSKVSTEELVSWAEEYNSKTCLTYVLANNEYLLDAICYERMNLTEKR